jgi:cytochrome c biogenesis protein
MTSIGVIKVPDNMPEQLGIISFFYPSAAELTTGAFTSVYPEPINPLLSMNVYTGDLGLDGGIPKNVFSLNTDGLLQVAGRSAEVPGLEMTVGETVDLPNGLGTVTFDGLRKFASLDIAYNPGQGWVLLFSLLSLLGVIISLLTPRRRVWVKKVSDGFEVAALSRRDDPQLEKTVEDLIQNIKKWKK